MPPRSRYAVDPSLTAPASAPAPPQEGHFTSYHQPPPDQHQHQQHPYHDYQQPHHVSQAQPPSQGAYQPDAQPRVRSYTVDRPEPAPQPAPQQYHSSLQQPTNHIAPPPHSAGPALTGPRVRIDPSQVPNPVEAQEMDQNLWDEEDFHSCQTRGIIPLAGTDYRGIDQGNSLPRHLRTTLATIPPNSQLLDTTALPLGLVIQPFAPLRYDEAPIPLVSNWVTGESAFDPSSQPEEEGPPRCDKCRGYVNPYVRWIDGGRKWTCNLCGQSNLVSNAYFSHLTSTGHRTDHNDRPELLHGTIDIPAPKAYWATQPAPSGSILDTLDAGPDLSKAAESLTNTASDLLGGLTGASPAGTRGPTPSPAPSVGGGGTQKEKLARLEEERKLRRPQGMGRVFVLDVSTAAVQRGVVREACEAIRRAVYGSKRLAEVQAEKESVREGEEEADEEDEEEILGRGERVALVTVAETVGFWNLSAKMPQAGLCVVGDLEDMFVPFREGFLVDPTESRLQLEGLLDALPGIAEAQPDGNRCALGAAVRGALSGLRMQGGQINIFTAGLPTIDPGKLTVREDQGIYNTDKERALFSPSDPFWRSTADELAECGISVNTFFFPESYTDVASIGALSAVTGGESYFHARFDPVRDRFALQSEVLRLLTGEAGYNATLRVRCSNGLRVGEHLGGFYQRSMTDVELAGVGEGSALAAILKYEGRLDEREMAYVQVALLYTTTGGERRVRVMNLGLGVTGLIGNVFRFADLDAVVTVFAKEAVNQMTSKNLRDIRAGLTARSNKVLLMYRRHCAAATQAGQLILPEGLKLLPLYTLCINKCKAIKGGTVTSDVRALYARRIRSAGVSATMALLYPRVLAVHDLRDDVGFPAGPLSRLRMPALMRAGYGWMVAEGAYIMINGETAMMWLGAAVSPQILDDLWGVDSLEEIDLRMTRLPKLPTLLSTQLRNILTHFERVYGRALPLTLVRQNMDGMEIEYANALVEDSNNDALSYTDYLMTAHKSITNEMSGSGGKGDSWRPW